MDLTLSPLTPPPSKAVLLPAKCQDLCQFEVICRVRPQPEPQTAEDIVVSEDRSTITIISQAKNISKQFGFNRIYNERTSQREFAQELAQQIFGRGSLVFSYGVTNSGKTYTILGTEEEPGLLPVLIERIEREFPEEVINITAIEAYNDEFFSLKDKQRLFPRENCGIYQFAQYQPEKITKESTKEMIAQYMANRNQTDTKANKKSSRSHAIFKVECEEISLAIVDLAGSERYSKAGSNIQQTSSINTSLLVLGKCIHAFRDNTIIPFRECKLTKALSEYFNPSYKIYMIAHLNRSGDMFHENIKVLEYAAVSSQVRQLNPHMNQSIMKSARKRMDIKEKAKSCIKFKEASPEPIKKDTSIPKSGLRLEIKSKVEVVVGEEAKELDQLMEEEYQNNRRKVMEVYINQMIGRNNDFDYYLDCEFEREDERDREFIEEMRATRYVSPEKRQTVNLQLAKAESRMRLRRQILDEIEVEKKVNHKEVCTSMGPSMKKCLEESVRRRWRSNGQVHSDQDEGNGNESKEVEQKQQSIKQVDEQENSFAKTTTPAKSKQGEGQGETYFERVISQSIKFKDTMLNALDTVINVVRSHSKRKSNKSMLKVKNVRFGINQQFEVNYAEKNSAVVPQQVSQNQRQPEEQKRQEEQKNQVKQKEQVEFKKLQVEQKKQVQQKKQRVQRWISSLSISEVQFAGNGHQSVDLSNLLKDLDSKEGTNVHNESNNSLLLKSFDSTGSNRKKEMRTIEEGGENDQHESIINSPFFKMNPHTQAESHYEEVCSKQVVPIYQCKKQQVHYEQASQSSTALAMDLMNHSKDETTQQSNNTTWDKQTSHGSSKPKMNVNVKKPLRQMKFVIADGVSPIKTRSQRAVLKKGR